jgi:hypothetical protein
MRDLVNFVEVTAQLPVAVQVSGGLSEIGDLVQLVTQGLEVADDGIIRPLKDRFRADHLGQHVIKLGVEAVARG